MKEALTLALEALETPRPFDSYPPLWRAYEKTINEAITEIKEALAQPEQTNTRPYYTIDELNAWADEKEKQAWRNAAIRIGEELSSVGPDGYYDMNAWQWLDWAMENVKKAQPEKTVCPFCSSEWVTAEQHDRKMDRLEQEPVALETVYETIIQWDEGGGKRSRRELARRIVSLYTTPPQRTWVGLTEDDDIDWEEGGNLKDLVKAIEAKLKEKNNG